MNPATITKRLPEAFDLPRLGGDDLRRLALSERREAQEGTGRSGQAIHYVGHAEGEGGAMYEAACKGGLEGGRVEAGLTARLLDRIR